MRLFLTLMFLFLAGVACPQTRVEGQLEDASGRGIDGAIVRVCADSTVLAYAISSGGHFQISFRTEARTVRLIAESMGCEPVEREILNRSQTCRLTMREKPTALKEVVIRAPAIYQRGDTLSYHLPSYAAPGDYTLGDALKRLPGIDVEPSGRIRYQGREISHFYIDGLDLLGGKYNLATANIPAAYVNSVQVLDNHQPVRMNRDIFSDDVALNIRMSPRARLKPFGTCEGAVGYGDGWLYGASGAGMLFKPGFQAIATLKIGNIRSFASEETASLFGDTDGESAAGKLMGDLSASAPPVERDRYESPSERQVSLHFIRKLGETATLRGAVDYGYSRSRYDYDIRRLFYDGEEDIVIDQEIRSQSTEHAPGFSIVYRNNAAESYLENRLFGRATFLDNRLPTIENGQSLVQQQSMRDYRVGNRFSSSWRRERLRWSVTSDLLVCHTPAAELAVTGDGEDLRQQAGGLSLRTEHTVLAIRDIGTSRLYFPLSLNYSADWIRTDLRTDPDAAESRNDVRGGRWSVAFAPRYEYTHPKRTYVFRAAIPVRLDGLSICDRIQSADRDFRLFSVCPELYFNYDVSSRSVLRTRVALTRDLGDVLDFLTSPVQTDHTTRQLGSGILHDTRSLQANLHYDYKIPLEMWFVRADVTYRREHHNVLSSQTVSSDLIQSTSLSMPNNTHRATAQLAVTKYLESVKTKVSLSGQYLWSRQQAVQNGLMTTYDWQSVGISPVLAAQPCRYVELDYSGEIGRTFLSYGDVQSSYWSQVHRVALKITPVELLELSASTDIVKRDLTRDLSKTMALLDLGITCRFKTLRFELSLRNALNQNSYSYSIYRSINTYRYHYRLRGRELLLTLAVTL